MDPLDLVKNVARKNPVIKNVTKSELRIYGMKLPALSLFIPVAFKSGRKPRSECITVGVTSDRFVFARTAHESDHWVFPPEMLPTVEEYVKVIDSMLEGTTCELLTNKTLEISGMIELMDNPKEIDEAITAFIHLVAGVLDSLYAAQDGDASLMKATIQKYRGVKPGQPLPR
jgi:hypothetical protein